MQLSPAHRQSGVSLIEVLIAMIVLSFGILTAVGLQLVSKRNSIDARQQMTASVLAYDLLERMRTNNAPAGLVGYLASASVGGGQVGDPNPDCSAAACTPPQLAAFDLWEWEQNMDGANEQISGGNVGGLTSPRACITGPAGGGSGIYTIVIAWRGATVLPNNAAVACGAASGLYGDNNEYRRTLSIQVFI